MRRHRLVIDPAKPEQCEKSTPPTHEIIREIHRQIICDTDPTDKLDTLDKWRPPSLKKGKFKGVQDELLAMLAGT